MNTERMIAMLAAAVMTGGLLQATANEIPVQLPKPDGKPVDMKKKVKVYILAGQSNMVGMGNILGARPEFPSVFLSADPAIIPGAMPVGGSGLAAHGVYPSANAKLEKGAIASLYKGAYDPKADYSKMTPVKTEKVPLGTVSAALPELDGPHTVVVNAFIDVPVSGTYMAHAGFEESTYSVISLDGQEAYRKEVGGKPVMTKVVLDAGKRYPVTITYFKSGSAAFWLEQVDIPGIGDLTTLTKKDKKFQYLVDDSGQWTVRNDVYFQEARLSEGGRGAPLSATANHKCMPKLATVGPEVGFGYVMGTFLDEQVLLIKTAQGNRSLGLDFRPPSSGRAAASNDSEGLEYRLMVKGVRETLDRIDKIVPGYAGQGYEIAGFGWFQGHKDSGSTKEDYEKNLVNLISDLRKEFKTPKMPVVVAAVGFDGYGVTQGPWKGVWEAQMAVGDPKQHPEWAGTVTSVDTRDFWREIDESPKWEGYHYNRNAETYLLVGEAMGRAMVRLMGGKAAEIPKSDREARFEAKVAAAAAKPTPTPEQRAAHTAAIKPLILDGALVAFLHNPRNEPSIKIALEGKKPASTPATLNDSVDEAVTYYQAAGINDYTWKPFGSDQKNATWNYFGFDLPEADSDGAEASNPKKKEEKAAAKVVFPAGTENWFAPGFDAGKAGWKTGIAPFGESAEKVVVPDFAQRIAATRKPATLCENDVLLLRQSFDLPPVKEGHRYRVRVGGSVHNNMGEGFEVYVNGKLLADVRDGILAWRREGHLPRGGVVYPDLLPEFKGGKITLAVANYRMTNQLAGKYMPPGPALSVWVEEMKIPTFEF